MHRNMLAGLVAILCVTAVSHVASQDCKTLVQPLQEVDNLLGRWAVVAGSLKDPKSATAFKGRDSIMLHLHNSSYTQTNRVGSTCQHFHRNITLHGHVINMKVKDFLFNATFLQTSCADCAVLSLDIQSPTYESHDVYLFSKRRQLEEKEMDEFEAQVACLNLPPAIFTDPTKELCPEHTEEHTPVQSTGLEQTDQQD